MVEVEVAVQAARKIKLFQSPTLATEHEIGGLVLASRLLESFGETDELIGNLLLCSACRLLPLQGNEKGLAVLVRDEIDEMAAPIGAGAYLDLCGGFVIESFQGQFHLFLEVFASCRLAGALVLTDRIRMTCEHCKKGEEKNSEEGFHNEKLRLD